MKRFIREGRQWRQQTPLWILGVPWDWIHNGNGKSLLYICSPRLKCKRWLVAMTYTAAEKNKTGFSAGSKSGKPSTNENELGGFGVYITKIFPLSASTSRLLCQTKKTLHFTCICFRYYYYS